jgi:hypothetical protein
MALAPAFGNNIDDRAAAAFRPVVVAEAVSVGAGGAASQDAGVEHGGASQLHRGTELAGNRLAHQPTVGDWQRERRQRIDRRRGARERVALAAVARASAQPAFQPKPTDARASHRWRRHA